jgi:hypothetical protein
MSQKLGQSPAFPTDYGYQENIGTVPDTGMTKRLLIAKDAMCAIISRDTQFNNNIGLPDVRMTVVEAYAYADELLRQESE